MRAWLSGVLMGLSGYAERLSFWLTDLSDRVRPRAKRDPSVTPITFALYSDHVAKTGPHPTFDDICKGMAAEQNDLMREIPLKEP